MGRNNKKKMNPLSDLIPEQTFELLNSKGLFNKKSLRDHQIRKQFLELKRNNKTIIEAIEIIREDYPHLQSDTIRKIVHQILK